MSNFIVVGLVIVVVLALLVGGRLIIRSGKHSIEVGRKEMPPASQSMEASGEGSVIDGARQEASGGAVDQKMSARDGGQIKDGRQDS